MNLRLKQSRIAGVLWLVALFLLGLLLTVASGCTLATGAGGGRWFIGYYGRVGVDLKAGKINLVRTPTTQQASIDNLDASINPDVARSIAEGVAQGVARGVMGVAGKP